VIRDDQPDAREGQAGRRGETERSAVPLKPKAVRMRNFFMVVLPSSAHLQPATACSGRM